MRWKHPQARCHRETQSPEFFMGHHIDGETDKGEQDNGERSTSSTIMRTVSILNDHRARPRRQSSRSGLGLLVDHLLLFSRSQTLRQLEHVIRHHNSACLALLDVQWPAPLSTSPVLAPLEPASAAHILVAPRPPTWSLGSRSRARHRRKPWWQQLRANLLLAAAH